MRAAIACLVLLGLAGCGASNGFTLATKPCGENVGPDYTASGNPGAAPANLNLGGSAQGCS